jgi:hypothetical protein
MKRRNPRWGCPRIAQQIALAFGVEIDKDVVRRITAVLNGVVLRSVESKSFGKGRTVVSD